MPPAAHRDRVAEHLAERGCYHHGVEAEVKDDKNDGDSDRFLEAAQEHGCQQCQEEEGDGDVLSLKPAGSDGVLDQVCAGVGSREGHGDHEVSGSKSQKDQD